METNKRSAKKYIFLVLVLLLVAALVVLPFALDRMNDSDGDGASIVSATVRRADISRTVSGAGTLEAKDAVDLTVPEGVVLTGYAVKDGDLVQKGDVVAYVDRVSVYSTASALADTLESVTEELSDLQKSAGKLQTVYSTVVGKVTKVYAERGSDISQLMQEYGCLAEIELDDGTVLKLTGTSGTISYFYFPAGTYVYVNAPIYAYTDVEGSGSYDALVKKHQKIEDQLAQLFQMYRDGYAVAPGDGMITGLDETLVKELGYVDEGGLQVQLLGNYSLGGGMTVQLLGAAADEVLSSTEKGDGKLGPDGTVDGTEITGLEGFDAKPGDTVIYLINTYMKVDSEGHPTSDPPRVEYEAFYVIHNKESNKPGGGMAGGFGGGGGGGMSFSSGSMGGAAEEEQEATLATTLIASVVPMDEVLVSITVDELDILSLHKGDKAQVTIDALPGHSFEGVVTGVNTSLTNNGGNSKYTVEVTMARSDDMLAGMNASCLVTVETFKDVLCIPADALYDEPDRSTACTALNKESGKPDSPVPVETGISDGENVEILSGLSEGQTIWYSVYDTPEYSLPSAGAPPFGGGSGPRV